MAVGLVEADRVTNNITKKNNADSITDIAILLHSIHSWKISE